MSALPSGLRNATICAAILGGMVTMGSCQGALFVADLGKKKFEEPAVLALDEQSREQARRIHRAQISATEPHSESRFAVLMLLSFSSGLVFFSALRLLRPVGLPREGMRRVLGGAALASALFRTVEGAQHAVIMKRVGPAMFAPDDPAVAKLPPEFLGFVHAIPSYATAGFTLVVASLFLLLAQYFRSDKVKQIVMFRDSQQS